MNMFYKPWTQVLPNLSFKVVQISFCWQGQWKMNSQLVKSERMSFYVDPTVQDFARLLAQIHILEQKLIKSSSHGHRVQQGEF